MKTRTLISIFTILLTLFALSACNASGTEPEVVDVEATVNAAVMATATAEAAAEAALEEMVNTAVDEAVDEAVDAVVDDAVNEAVDAAVNEAIANATPAPEYTTYTEEELILLIEESTQEAETAAYTYTEATTTAVNDGTVTAEEAAEITYYVTVSEETLDEVDQMIQTYYALYGGTGDEVVAELVAIESELNELNESADEMVVILDEINTTLADGYELAETTIAQLEQTAEEAQTAVSEVASQTQAWAAEAQAGITLAQENFTPPEGDLSSILEGSVPTDIAGTQDEAMAQVLGYISTANSALADNTISPQEMQEIAQMGSNAAASLTAQGNAGSAALANNINGLSQQMAQGDIQGAISGLSGLQAQLPDLSGLSLPAGMPSTGGSNRPSR